MIIIILLLLLLFNTKGRNFLLLGMRSWDVYVGSICGNDSCLCSSHQNPKRTCHPLHDLFTWHESCEWHSGSRAKFQLQTETSACKLIWGSWKGNLMGKIPWAYGTKRVCLFSSHVGFSQQCLHTETTTETIWYHLYNDIKLFLLLLKEKS